MTEPMTSRQNHEARVETIARELCAKFTGDPDALARVGEPLYITNGLGAKVELVDPRASGVPLWWSWRDIARSAIVLVETTA